MRAMALKRLWVGESLYRRKRKERRESFGAGRGRTGVLDVLDYGGHSEVANCWE